MFALFVLLSDGSNSSGSVDQSTFFRIPAKLALYTMISWFRSGRPPDTPSSEASTLVLPRSSVI
ncbi:hypothetical protein TMatcc_000629 [Talaromyces marneffei ATCC 18224]